jgi:phosphoglycerol transferase MdoB-like AlkP superfamily enzyme
LIHSTGQRFIVEKNYMSDAEVEANYPIVFKKNEPESFRKLNVVIITLESFGKEYSKYFNTQIDNYQGFTPFFDSLAQQSLYCENSFANGLRSTQGIVSITAGLPVLMDDPYMFSPYQSNRLDGLASLLKSKGYATTFFHGSNPGSMDFDKFANLTGFDTFYDRYGFGNQAEYDGAWGIWDEPMLQFMANKLNNMPQPFYGFFFSLTSHHPFKVPLWFEQKYPNMDAHDRSFLYADYALSRFFEKARTMSWFGNTLFVLCADHTGVRSRFEEYQTKVGRYKIPIIFYKPNEIKPTILPKTCQQIDIMPTVLDFLKYDKPYLSFGRSIFNTTEGYAFQYEENLFQIENNRYVLFFDGEKTTGLFDFKNDILLKKDLKNQMPHEREQLEKTLKSVIQQHHKAMIFNRLTKNQF